MASSSIDNSKQEALKKVQSHEVAIAELEALSSSRAVYQKSGNIFFHKDTKTALASEKEQLDMAKAQLQKLNKV